MNCRNLSFLPLTMDTLNTLSAYNTYFSKQLRQLSNIHRNAPCLIKGQHLGDVRLFTGLSGVDVDEGLAGSVENFEAARYLLNLPGRRKTTW
jgi:hypothetical protein